MARPIAKGHIIFVTSDIVMDGVPGYRGGCYYKILEKSKDILSRVMASGKARSLGFGSKYGDCVISETPRIKVQL